MHYSRPTNQSEPRTGKRWVNWNWPQSMDHIIRECTDFEQHPNCVNREDGLSPQRSLQPCIPVPQKHAEIFLKRQAVTWPMVALCPKGIIFMASCSCDVHSSFLLLSKDKHKVMLLHGMKTYGAIRGVPPLILNCGTRKEGSGKLHIPTALFLEGELQFLLNGRGWVVARAGLDILGHCKTSCVSQTQPQFFSHRAQSLGTNYPVLTYAVLH